MGHRLIPRRMPSKAPRCAGLGLSFLGWLLLGFLGSTLWLGCRCEGAGGPEALVAEDRYGNDAELVSVFDALARCSWQHDSLDHSCDALRLVRERLASKRKSGKFADRLGITLANLLESKKAPTRWAVSQNLYHFLAHPRLRTAILKAYEREKVSSIRVAMLRQLCQRRDANLDALLAKALAAGGSSLPERVRAIRCFARGAPPPPPVVDALAKILVSKEDAELKSAACGVLGAHRLQRHVQALGAGLADLRSQGLCANALAKLADSGACAVLYGHFTGTDPSGAQLIASLGAYGQKRCWPAGGLSSRLVTLVKAKQTPADRALQAVTLLGQLGAKESLQGVLRLGEAEHPHLFRPQLRGAILAQMKRALDGLGR